MIIDQLKNAKFYYELGDKYKKAFDFLKNNDLKNFKNGKYEIDGKDIFIIIQDYNSKNPEEGIYEAHRKFVDIQYIIKGQESLGYLNIDKFAPGTEYDEEKDLIFGNGEGVLLNAKEGYFLIFAPQDAHMPGICIDKPEYVKKAVVKIKV